MNSIFNKIQKIYTNYGKSADEKKKIVLLNSISILVLVFFAFISMMAYVKISSPILGHLFLFNVIIILITIPISKLLNADISKFIISMFVPVAFIIEVAYAKSINITDDLIFYLAPRMVLTITIIIPILLFGYKELKKTIIAITPGIIVFIFYDVIHSWFDVYLTDLPFNAESYNTFVMMVISFFILVTLSILSLQFINFKSERKLLEMNNELATSEEELKQQNEEISAINDNLEEQKDFVKQKNQNIIQSINYAKRIQNAMLPSLDILKNNFTDYFLIYKPARIVSGDFYYFNETENEIIIAIADCTGHGVPGGFMTMLGQSFLDHIINKNKTIDTGQILGKLRSMIMNSLNQIDMQSETTDGIDIAICKMEKSSLKIQYSGAHNPIMLIKNKQTEIIKADRMPIGIYPKMKSFKTNSRKLEKNDLIYLYSDGFQDQFGGSNNKKYRRNKFYKLLKTNANKLIKKQNEIIKIELQNWMGNNKQTDDILILGIKI